MELTSTKSDLADAKTRIKELEDDKFVVETTEEQYWVVTVSYPAFLHNRKGD